MINTIIFDFAGVVTKEGFRKGLIKRLKTKFVFDEESFNKRFLEHEDQYMSGKKDSRHFWSKLCMGIAIPYDDFAFAFTRCYEFNPVMVVLIRALKKSCQVIMLSDNFDILSEEMKSVPLVKELFEKVFFSNELGVIKKNPKAFEIVLNALGVEPGECLFIDDKEHNLVEARILGIHTLLFTGVVSLKKSLGELGVTF